MNLKDDIPLKKHIAVSLIAICLFLPGVAQEAEGYDMSKIYIESWDTGTIKWEPILHTERTPELSVKEVKYFGNGTCMPYARVRTGIAVSGSACTILDRVDESWIKDKPAVGGTIVLNEGKCGHIAVVEEITEDGLKISEQNYKGLYIVSERVISKDYERILGYIYP